MSWFCDIRRHAAVRFSHNNFTYRVLTDPIDMEPEHVTSEVKPDVSEPLIPQDPVKAESLTPGPETPGLDVSSEFTPKSIVLAKVKGYPPWPAMVLDENILPEHIINKKPKTVKAPKLKAAKPITVVPVRFFSDDTYIWIKTNEIKPLTSNMIDAFLTKPTKRKDNLLESAYNLAKDPLDMQLFVSYGSSGKPPPGPEYIPEPESEISMESVESEQDENDEDEPPKKRKKPGPKPKKDTKKKGKPGPKPKAASKPGPKPKVKPEPKVVEEVDPDWGIEENMEELYKEGNYIFDNKSEQIQFQTQFPTSEVISHDLHVKSQTLQELSDKLIPQLLEESNEPETIKLLNKMVEQPLPKSLVVRSKLFKVLVLTNRKPIDSKLRGVIDLILKQWGDLTVQENPEMPEPTPEPKLEPQEPAPQEPAPQEPVPLEPQELESVLEEPKPLVNGIH